MKEKTQISGSQCSKWVCKNPHNGFKSKKSIEQEKFKSVIPVN